MEEEQVEEQAIPSAAKDVWATRAEKPDRTCCADASLSGSSSTRMSRTCVVEDSGVDYNRIRVGVVMPQQPVQDNKTNKACGNVL